MFWCLSPQAGLKRIPQVQLGKPNLAKLLSSQIIYIQSLFSAILSCSLLLQKYSYTHFPIPKEFVNISLCSGQWWHVFLLRLVCLMTSSCLKICLLLSFVTLLFPISSLFFLYYFPLSPLPSPLWFLGKSPTIFCLCPSYCVGKRFPSTLWSSCLLNTTFYSLD